MCTYWATFYYLHLGKHISNLASVPWNKTSNFVYPTIHPDRLTTEDLYILTSILKAAAPKWQTIGGALGFVNDNLTIIQRKPLLIPEGDTGYFREMLSQWLKWAPPNHYWPTITALEGAVRDSGHESLAYNFREQFLLKKGRLKHLCI